MPAITNDSEAQLSCTTSKVEHLLAGEIDGRYIIAIARASTSVPVGEIIRIFRERKWTAQFRFTGSRGGVLRGRCSAMPGRGSGTSGSCSFGMGTVIAAGLFVVSFFFSLLTAFTAWHWLILVSRVGGTIDRGGKSEDSRLIGFCGRSQGQTIVQLLVEEWV
jgi:hypothetical protein